MTLQIRLVEESDMEQLCFLLEEAFDTKIARNKHEFIKAIATPNQYIFVGFEDGLLVATHMVTIENKLIHDYGKVAHMEDLAVLTSHKKRGLAKEMLDNSTEFCKRAGAYKILATCVPDMVGYYNRTVGFEEHEISLRRDLL